MIEQYVQDHYKKECSRVNLCFNQAGHLQIDISCINIQLGKCWTGEWQSKWCIDIQNQQLHGLIKVNNHYWEYGNIQFHLSKTYKEQQLANADAQTIIEAINKNESDYQAIVEDTLENAKEDMFKKLRRALPVTGQKFDWAGQKGAMMS